MRKIRDFFNVIFLSAVYCYALGSLSFSHVKPISDNTEKGAHFTSVSTDLFSGIVHSERNFSPSRNYSDPSFKTHLGGPWTLEKNQKAAFISQYSQYVSFSKNLRIRHRKADIIFPFHYFW